METDILRWLHAVGAAVLLGTGAGIAFFMMMAYRTGDVRLIAGVARIVVIADFVFTATAVVLQPATGILLAISTGWSLGEGWIQLSLLLFVVTGAFWLPVVWIQIILRRIAEQAIADGTPLPETYHRLYRIWFAFGFPAFTAVLAIFWLMLTRPAIAW